jgi:hypothetical protein
MARRATGKIIDGQNFEPLMFAWIFIRGTNLITKADIDGKFELYLPDDENEATVAYTGYPDTSFIIKPGTDDIVNNIETALLFWEPHLSGTKEYIKNYNVGAYKKTTPKLDTLDIMPEHYIAFIKYLKTNSKIYFSGFYMI